MSIEHDVYVVGVVFNLYDKVSSGTPLNEDELNVYFNLTNTYQCSIHELLNLTSVHSRNILKSISEVNLLTLFNIPNQITNDDEYEEKELSEDVVKYHNSQIYTLISSIRILTNVATKSFPIQLVILNDIIDTRFLTFISTLVQYISNGYKQSSVYELNLVSVLLQFLHNLTVNNNISKEYIYRHFFLKSPTVFPYSCTDFSCLPVTGQSLPSCSCPSVVNTLPSCPYSLLLALFVHSETKQLHDASALLYSTLLCSQSVTVELNIEDSGEITGVYGVITKTNPTVEVVDDNSDYHEDTHTDIPPYWCPYFNLLPFVPHLVPFFPSFNTSIQQDLQYISKQLIPVHVPGSDDNTVVHHAPLSLSRVSSIADSCVGEAFVMIAARDVLRLSRSQHTRLAHRYNENDLRVGGVGVGVGVGVGEMSVEEEVALVMDMKKVNDSIHDITLLDTTTFLNRVLQPQSQDYHLSLSDSTSISDDRSFKLDQLVSNLNNDVYRDLINKQHTRILSQVESDRWKEVRVKAGWLLYVLHTLFTGTDVEVEILRSRIDDNEVVDIILDLVDSDDEVGVNDLFSVLDEDALDNVWDMDSLDPHHSVNPLVMKVLTVEEFRAQFHFVSDQHSSQLSLISPLKLPVRWHGVYYVPLSLLMGDNNSPSTLLIDESGVYVIISDPKKPNSTHLPQTTHNSDDLCCLYVDVDTQTVVSSPPPSPLPSSYIALPLHYSHHTPYHPEHSMVFIDSSSTSHNSTIDASECGKNRPVKQRLANRHKAIHSESDSLSTTCVCDRCSSPCSILQHTDIINGTCIYSNSPSHTHCESDLAPVNLVKRNNVQWYLPSSHNNSHTNSHTNSLTNSNSVVVDEYVERLTAVGLKFHPNLVKYFIYVAITTINSNSIFRNLSSLTDTDVANETDTNNCDIDSLSLRPSSFYSRTGRAFLVSLSHLLTLSDSIVSQQVQIHMTDNLWRWTGSGYSLHPETLTICRNLGHLLDLHSRLWNIGQKSLTAPIKTSPLPTDPRTSVDTEINKRGLEGLNGVISDLLPQSTSLFPALSLSPLYFASPLVHAVALASSILVDGVDYHSQHQHQHQPLQKSIPSLPSPSSMLETYLPCLTYDVLAPAPLDPRTSLIYSDVLDVSLIGVGLFLHLADADLFDRPKPLFTHSNSLHSLHSSLDSHSPSQHTVNTIHTTPGLSTVTYSNSLANTNTVTSSMSSPTPLSLSFPLLTSPSLSFLLSLPIYSSPYLYTSTQLLLHLVPLAAPNDYVLQNMRDQMVAAHSKRNTTQNSADNVVYDNSVDISNVGLVSHNNPNSDSSVLPTICEVEEEDVVEDEEITAQHQPTPISTPISTPIPSIEQIAESYTLAIPSISHLMWVYIAALLHSAASVDQLAHASDGMAEIIEESGTINTNTNSVKNSVKKSESNSKNNISEIAHSPYGFKSDILQLVSNVSYVDSSLQNILGALGMVEQSLANSALDDNNKYMREWSVMAVRNLTEQCHSNQLRVSVLGLSGVAQNNKLEEMGMQVWVEGDKVKVKDVRQPHKSVEPIEKTQDNNLLNNSALDSENATSVDTTKQSKINALLDSLGDVDVSTLSGEELSEYNDMMKLIQDFTFNQQTNNPNKVNDYDGTFDTLNLTTGYEGGVVSVGSDDLGELVHSNNPNFITDVKESTTSTQDVDKPVNLETAELLEVMAETNTNVHVVQL